MIKKLIRKIGIISFITLIISTTLVVGFQPDDSCFDLNEIGKNREYQSFARDPFVSGSGFISAHCFVFRLLFFPNPQPSIFFIHSDGKRDYLKHNGETYSFPNGLDILVFGFKDAGSFPDEGEPGNLEGFAMFFIAY